MLNKEIKVIAPNGMSQRYATAIVHESNNFNCDVKLILNNDVIDAKSIMNVLAMSVDVRQDTKLTLSTDGPDEAEALGSIIAMLKKMSFIS
jgi:phosphotransferase system HPr (HPr) family protein